MRIGPIPNSLKLALPVSVAFLILASAGVLAQKGGTTGGDAASGGGNPPPSPTGLTANGGQGPQEIVLSWSASSGATGYKVLRSTSSGGAYSQIATPSTTSYTDSGLPNAATYYYEVEATNSDGTSGASNVASAETLAAVPTGLTANGGTAPQTVVLGWSGSAGATSYGILRSTAANGPFSSVGSSSTTNFSDTTASAGIDYYYEVTANDASGPSAASQAASALTLPAAPALSATGGDTEVSLSWGTVASASGYTVTRSNTQNGNPTATFNVTNTTLVDDALTNGNVYYYTIYATNGTGNSPTATASAQTSGIIPAVGGGLTGEYAHYPYERVTENDQTLDSTQVAMPPSGISPSASSSNGGDADVWTCRWSGYMTPPVSGSYSLQLNNCWVVSISVNGTQIYYNNNFEDLIITAPVTLTAGQKATVVVQLSAALSSSRLSTQLQWKLPGNQSFETIAANYLSPAVSGFSTPAGLSAASSQSGSSVNLNWTDSQSVSCNLYRTLQSGAEDYTGSAVNSSPVNPTQNGGTAYADSDGTAQTGTDYFYTCRTVYANPVTGDRTQGTPSTEADATTAGYPPMPFELGAYATRTTQVSLYWGAYPGASGYNIYRGTSAGGESTTPLNSSPYSGADQNPGVQAFFYNDPGLTTGQAYYYLVKAVVNGQEVAVTDEASATPNSTAIPYDTGDPAQIVGAVSGTISSAQYYVPGFVPEAPPHIYVQGPDGTGYALEPDSNGNLTVPASYPPLAYFDEYNNQFHDSQGNIAPMPLDFPSDDQYMGLNQVGSWQIAANSQWDWLRQYPNVSQSDLFAGPAAPAALTYSGYNATWPPTGPFREVQAVPGYEGLMASVFLPYGSYAPTGMNASPPSPEDTAYIYTGFDGGGFDADVGFQFGHEYNAPYGWKIVFRYGSPATHGTHDLSPQGNGAVFVRGSPVIMCLLPPLAPDGHIVFSVADNDDGQTQFSYVKPNMQGAISPSQWYVLPAPGITRTTYQSVMLKRINAIAQQLKKPFIDPTTHQWNGQWVGNEVAPDGPTSGV